MPDSSFFQRIIREPLGHFLLIGLLIFLLYDQVAAPPGDDNDRILLSSSDIVVLEESWQLRWNRPPTPRELKGIVENHVREQVMYREALKLGLDKNDSIVRRRMAQKLDFLFRDLTQQIEPTDPQLTDFLAANPERFEHPARLTFSHIYLSPDKRGPNVESDAAELLIQLREMPLADIDPASLGDRFMLQHELSDYSSREVARLMGTRFSEALDDIEPGAWQGPINSGYGLHLVYIQDRSAARMPGLDEIRDRVVMEYVSEQQRIANESFYQELRDRYEVIVEWPADLSDSGDPLNQGTSAARITD